ncbi:MAG: riboflavin biosynthesis protein RibF [Firmicutes bacterium]|nr:riboflavin biosynthesis protein RibF [Bacillota bacterium]
MERLTQTDPKISTVVLIGNFDGVHAGHQALIRQAKRISQKHHWRVVALTFDPHPSVVLRPHPPKKYLITPLDLKIYWMEYYGVDYVSVLSFNHELAMVPPMAFLTLEVRQKLRAEAVVVGYNFTFGAGGTGSIETLKNWGELTGVKVRIVEPINTESLVVSSSAIRQYIIEGHISEANNLLAHPFSVQGVAQKGAGRGSQIGIPTLNCLPPSQQIMPPFGVYAGYLSLNGSETRWPGVANWGIRPTFQGEEAAIQQHVIDRDLGDLHDQSMRFDFYHSLRPEKKFDRIEALVSQIRQDIDQARKLL